MVLTRKIRKWGPHSFAVVIPRQVAQMCDMEEDTIVEIEAFSKDRLQIINTRTKATKKVPA